jgi:phosphatidylinositol glycan class S
LGFDLWRIDPTIRLVDDTSNASPYLENGTLIFPINVAALHDLDSTHDACTAVRSSTAKQTLDQLIPPRPHDIPSHAIKYTEDVRLSFVLLNEDSSVGSGFTGWQVDEAVNGTPYPSLQTPFSDIAHFTAYIKPLMTALAPFHTFSIESQILHHAPIKFSPLERQIGDVKAWSVSRAQAGLFVNTEQWTLGALFFRLSGKGK